MIMAICKETIEVEMRPGPSRAGVYVITDGGNVVGKIIYAYPRDGAGILYAALWDWSGKEVSRDIQHGRATGCGYDKKSECIDGMRFGTGDQEFTLDCPGTGMSVAEAQFRAHGYNLQWLL